MLSLVSQAQVDTETAEKQMIMNKIIAAGLNSLSSYTNNNANGPEKQLLETFASKSFDIILACWPMLDDKIKFFIFKHYIVDFEGFMRDKVTSSNV